MRVYVHRVGCADTYSSWACLGDLHLELDVDPAVETVEGLKAEVCRRWGRQPEGLELGLAPPGSREAGPVRLTLDEAAAALHGTPEDRLTLKRRGLEPGAVIWAFEEPGEPGPHLEQWRLASRLRLEREAATEGLDPEGEEQVPSGEQHIHGQEQQSQWRAALLEEQLRTEAEQVPELQEQRQAQAERVAELQEQLRAKDQRAGELEKQLRHKDEQLRAEQQQRADKDLRAWELETQLRHKDEQLRAEQRQVADKDRRAVELEKQLQDKDEQLRAEQQHVAELWEQAGCDQQRVTQLQVGLQATNVQAGELENQLKRKDEQLQAEQHQAAELWEQAGRDKRRASELQEQLLASEKEVAELRAMGGSPASSSNAGFWPCKRRRVNPS